MKGKEKVDRVEEIVELIRRNLVAAQHAKISDTIVLRIPYLYGNARNLTVSTELKTQVLLKY